MREGRTGPSYREASLLKIIHPRKQKEEWITEEISQLQRKERKLYIKRKSSNNFLHKLQHIHTKNSLDNKIKQAKKKYYEEFFTNNRNDPKKLGKP